VGTSEESDGAAGLRLARLGSVFGAVFGLGPNEYVLYLPY